VANAVMTRLRVALGTRAGVETSAAGAGSWPSGSVTWPSGAISGAAGAAAAGASSSVTRASPVAPRSASAIACIEAGRWAGSRARQAAISASSSADTGDPRGEPGRRLEQLGRPAVGEVVERQVAGERLVQRHAERPDVDARGGQPAGDLLRRHVRQRADPRPGRARAAAERAGDPEVDDLRCVAGEHDVSPA